MTVGMNKSDREWQTELSPERYRVLRQADTEPPWVGKYVHNHEDGTYRCAGCASVLFDAGTKFESGSGWPSFYQAARADAVELVADDKPGMARTEVRCRACGGHLGPPLRRRSGANRPALLHELPGARLRGEALTDESSATGAPSSLPC